MKTANMIWSWWSSLPSSWWSHFDYYIIHSFMSDQLHNYYHENHSVTVWIKHICSLPELCLFCHTGCFWSKIDIKLNPNLMWHCKAKFVTTMIIMIFIVTKKLEVMKISHQVFVMIMMTLMLMLMIKLTVTGSSKAALRTPHWSLKYTLLNR